MRTHGIVKSLDSGQSRFALCHQAFNAIHKLHNSVNRIQDRADDALQRLAGAEHQLSVDPKIGSVAALKAGPEVALEPPAEASAPEPMADVPPSGPSALTGDDRAATITEL